LDIAQGRTKEAWEALLSGLPGTCRSPTAGGGRRWGQTGEPALPSQVAVVQALAITGTPSQLTAVMQTFFAGPRVINYRRSSRALPPTALRHAHCRGGRLDL